MSASEQSKQTSQSRPSNFGIQHYFFQPHTQKPKSAPPPSSTSVPNSASSSNSETVHNLHPSDSVHCISSPQNEPNRHSPSANRFNPSSGWSQEGDRDENASNNPTDTERQHFMEDDTEQPQPVFIGGAETVLKIQPTSSVFVAYHPLFGPHEDLILLELDEKLIPDVLDHKVSLRGQMDEDAVLCTQSKTYAVKFVGTSNTALLIPPSDQPLLRGSTQDRGEKDNEKKMIAPVIKVASGVMELVEAAPRLDKLKVLLSENPYGFHENEMLETDELDGMGRNNTGLYRWDDLIDNIQASNEEIRSGLQALSAVEIDGYWRIVEENYMDGMLKMLLNNSVLNDWSLSALNESEVGGVLQSDGFPHSLAHHCLQVYGSKVSEGIWRLDEKRVCVHFARGILRGGKMRMDNFMVEWMKKIPEGMQASFDMLKGEVLTEKLGIESWLYVFSVSSLPSSPAERFSMLFRERPKWEWKDLQPYIRDLSVPGLSAEGLLLKYTRRTQPTADAEPVLSSR